MSMSNGVETLQIKSHQCLTDNQKGVVKALKVLLADELVLFTKLRNYQWNMLGVNSYPLHIVVRDQIHIIADMEDTIAERIRWYGANVPGTMGEFKRNTHLFEEPGLYPDARVMVANLLDDHETIIRFIRKDIKKIDEESNAINIVDFLTRVLQGHEKMAQVLRMCLVG